MRCPIDGLGSSTQTVFCVNWTGLPTTNRTPRPIRLTIPFPTLRPPLILLSSLYLSVFVHLPLVPWTYLPLTIHISAAIAPARQNARITRMRKRTTESWYFYATGILLCVPKSKVCNERGKPSGSAARKRLVDRNLLRRRLRRRLRERHRQQAILHRRLHLVFLQPCVSVPFQPSTRSYQSLLTFTPAGSCSVRDHFP